jgi:hypothetical protein
VSQDRRTILRFAAVGLGITVVWLVCQMLTNPSPWSPLNTVLSVVFMILCPPVLITIPLLDDQIGTGGFLVLSMAVALLNGALYAGFGSAYVGLRKLRNGVL